MNEESNKKKESFHSSSSPNSRKRNFKHKHRKPKAPIAENKDTNNNKSVNNAESVNNKKSNNNNNDYNKQNTNQGKKNTDKKQRTYHKKRRKPFRRQDNHKKDKIMKPVVYDICPVCSKEIKDPLSAIQEKESQKNAHFECVVAIVKKDNPLVDNEKIYYLGGGSFGIVLERKNRNRTSIFIKRRIQYLDKPKKMIYDDSVKLLQKN